MSIYTASIPSILTVSGTDSRYQPYGYISYGTPAQSFKVLLDTGSAAPFISAKNCVYTGGKGNQPAGTCLTKLFDSSKSSTYNIYKGKFKYSFGSDTYKGGFGQDTLQIGNLSSPNFIMGLPTKVTLGLNELDFDGIIGLGANDGSEPNTFIQTMAKSHLASQQFSFYFPQSNILENGEFMIGGSNKELYSGPVKWLQIPDQFWDVPSFTINVDGKIVNNVPFSQDNTYIDTGTDILMGPTNEIKLLCTAIGTTFDNNSGFCQTPCANLPNVKNFTISFTNTDVILPINVQNYFSFPHTPESATCDIAIQNGGDPGNWGIGLSVIRQYYTIWDVSQPQFKLGFATPVSSLVKHHEIQKSLYSNDTSSLTMSFPVLIFALFLGLKHLLFK